MLLTVFAFTTVDAQIFKNQKKRAEERAKQRTQQKAQSKVDRKVDEAVDDAFESIGGLFKKKKKKQENENPQGDERNDSEEMDDAAESMSDMMAMFGGGKSPADLNLPDSYDFDTEVRTKMTSINKRGKEEVTYLNYLFGDDANSMGYEMEEEDKVLGVIDMGRMKMVAVIPDQNMASVMDMKATLEMTEQYKVEKEKEEEEVDVEKLKINKTGKTKTIAGYKCVQYTIESEEVEGEMWKAEGFNKMDLLKFGSSMGQMTQQNKGIKLPSAYTEMIEGGFLFEGNFYDKESGERTIMLVEEVMEKDQTVDLTKYKLMDMSQFMKK